MMYDNVDVQEPAWFQPEQSQVLELFKARYDHRSAARGRCSNK